MPERQSECYALPSRSEESDAVNTACIDFRNCEHDCEKSVDIRESVKKNRVFDAFSCKFHKIMH